MRSHGRRHFLKGSLAVAGFSLLSGCEGSPSQVAKVRRIGFLAVGSRKGRTFMIDGLLQGLREHGYVVDQNIAIEYRFSEDHNERLPALAAELVNLKVELIVASGSPASLAAKQATTTIPIVMGSLAANPIEAGFIASLARPGGNITGMTEMASQLSGKRLELIKASVPNLTRVAFLWNPPNPATAPLVKELEAAAPRLEVKLQRLEARVPDDLEGAFKAAVRQRAGALYVPSDPLTNNRPQMIADLALTHRLPTISDYGGLPKAGGLLSYGPDFADSYRRAAEFVDKILKGANPGELPMEQPTKFDLVVNQKTARFLGLTIPQSVLQQATQVIE